MFLELRQVSFAYPHQKKPALDGVNLIFDKKGITAVVGPNGSGKTTLTKLMVGILQPNIGWVYLDSRSLREYSLAEIGRSIAYVFQNPSQQLFCATVEEEIGFGLKHLGRAPEVVKERVDYYLDYFELSAYRNIFPHHLSYGEIQRVAIAAVLANNTDFIILDEPTAGLDAYRKRLLENYLGKIVRLGKGMVIISHDFNFVERMADRVIILEKGQVHSDSSQKGNTGYEA